MTGRRLGALLTITLLVTLAPTVAHADAATPTDYRSEVVAVTPPVPGLGVTIEGGDAFVRLRAPQGSEIVVLGYAGEPYLRFDPDGAVSENRRSAATYENERRFGGSDLPEFVDADAPPDWRVVGDGGVWAWHDHRSHWMGTTAPIGLEPGQSLPVQTIPILVDGRPTSIDVRTTLIAPPSRFPVAFGLIVGLGLALGSRLLGRATATLATLVVSIAAVVVGGGQFLSLPAETGPLIAWWALPAVAVLAGVVAIATYGRSTLYLDGLLALAGSQLVIWAFLRRGVLTHPILPTDVAFWFDRAVTATALGVGALIAAMALWSVATFNRQRDPALRRSPR